MIEQVKGLQGCWMLGRDWHTFVASLDLTRVGATLTKLNAQHAGDQHL